MEQARLDKILENHKLWLKTNGREGKIADLRNADLSHTDLSHTDLSYADLSYADLSYADLRYADLSHTDLCNANLFNVNLHYADLRYANLHYANLCYAHLCNVNLHYANLRNANLCYADLDYSAFPLWCGGLDVHIDDRQATQLLYHLIRNVQHSKNTSKSLKKICRIKSLIKQANKFHRAYGCGVLKEREGE